MTTGLYLAAALTAYLVAGINPSIIFARRVYHQDIHDRGSGNPGFANFKRVYGGRYSWYVLLFDLAKTVLVETVFGLLFHRAAGAWQLGVAFTGLFAALGHAYPVWYGFKGGKCVVVAIATAWLLDWRAGLVTVLILLVLLQLWHYMSLATICGLLSCPVTLWLVGTDSPWVPLLAALLSLFVAFRHKGNIRRLLNGTELKFSWKSGKGKGGGE